MCYMRATSHELDDVRYNGKQTSFLNSIKP